MLPPFRLLRPTSVEEAVQRLSEHAGEAMVVAGGTDLIPNLQMGLFAPRVLVDIKGIATLREVTFDPRRGLTIGALVTLSRLCSDPCVRDHFPALMEAAASVAGPLQRNMGTLGGNLCLETRCLWYNQSKFWRSALGGCLKKDGTVCHVAPGGRRCWAVWSSDTAPALLVLDAEVEIVGPGRRRRIPLAELYTQDGMHRLSLAADELLVRVHVPAASAVCRSGYRKFRLRDSIDYPLAGVAVALTVDSAGVCRQARVAVTAVNPGPRLVPEASQWLVGRVYSPDLVEEVAHAAIRTAKPLTTSASTPVYRREMVRLFTRQMLEQLWRQPTG